MPNHSVDSLFIQEALKKYGLRLHSYFVDDLKIKDLISDKEGGGDHLYENIEFVIKRAGDLGGEIQFIFPSYGRFIEIQYFKTSKNSSKLKSRQVNNKLWAKRTGFKSKRDTRWYTANFMGNLNELIGELMYGFTDEVKADLHNRLIAP